MIKNFNNQRIEDQNHKNNINLRRWRKEVIEEMKSCRIKQLDSSVIKKLQKDQ